MPRHLPASLPSCHPARPPGASLGHWMHEFICCCLACFPRHPLGRDGEKAYDCFSRALDLLGDGAHSGSGAAAGQLPPLAPRSQEAAVEGDVPLPLTTEEVRFSALTWIGR